LQAPAVFRTKRAQRIGQTVIGDLQRLAHGAHATIYPHGHDDTEFAQTPAQQVDPRVTCLLALLAQPVQLLQLLLIDRFDRHGTNLRAARRLDQRRRVGGVGLVAPNIGAHVLRRQQPNLMSLRLQRTRPVMRAEPHASITMRLGERLAKNCTKHARVRRSRRCTRYSASLIANSKRVFARSTPTVAAYIADSFCQGFC
jgi:hypothetical protein